jgi:hypothetical protein
MYARRNFWMAMLAATSLVRLMCESAPRPRTKPRTPHNAWIGAVAGQVCAGLAEAPFRGVNLGGWLVLESWITPYLWSEHQIKGEGEWYFVQTLGPEKARYAGIT